MMREPRKIWKWDAGVKLSPTYLEVSSLSLVLALNTCQVWISFGLNQVVENLHERGGTHVTEGRQKEDVAVFYRMESKKVFGCQGWKLKDLIWICLLFKDGIWRCFCFQQGKICKVLLLSFLVCIFTEASSELKKDESDDAKWQFTASDFHQVAAVF